MHPFPDVCKTFGTSNNHQETIYVSPEGRKKDTNSPSRKQEKKCIQKLSYFSPNCEFEVFLAKFTNYNICKNKPFPKIRREFSLSWNPENSNVRKNSILVNFHIRHKKIYLSKPLVGFCWAPIDHTMSIDKHIGAFRHIESKKFQYMGNLIKQTANMREKATSFRPKKHQDGNASEASEFLCIRFQMSTKH